GCDVPAKELDILLVLLADTKRKPEQEQYSLTKSNERYGDETEDGDIPLAEVSSDTKATWKNAWHIEYQRMLNLMIRSTLLHMLFSSVLCFVLTKVLKILKFEEGMTLEM
ncbi:hypothetical protein Tco_1468973, partial [Tanacetum coccineum]